MIVGRVFVLLLVLVFILWIFVVQVSQGGQFFIYIQFISFYLQLFVVVVFIMGCFWKRINEKGVFWGLILGLFLGLVRLVLDFIYVQLWCDQLDECLVLVKSIYYFYFFMILFMVIFIIVFIVSWFIELFFKEMVSYLIWFICYDFVVQKELVLLVVFLFFVFFQNGMLEVSSSSRVQFEMV